MQTLFRTKAVKSTSLHVKPGDAPPACARFQWKRYWCPRDGAFSLADGGYLIDPETTYGKLWGGDILPFDEIRARPCLVLLGEPGIGKSTALDAEHAIVQASVAGTNDKLLFLDLREYGDESRLARDLFDCDPFDNWLKGSHTLHIFLDSLDECRLEIRNIASLLSGKLKSFQPHAQRLRFRIACRTAEWPGSLESALSELWPDEMGVYELMPLRRRDVVEAAEAHGLNATTFLAGIAEKEAEPLAINPITLGLLLRIFQRDGRFPATRGELYEEGCRGLCDEPSQSRRDAGHTGTMSAGRRLEVASRIAALVVFCGKDAINCGGFADQEPDDLFVSDIEGGTESFRNERFGIGESEIREVLQTALFAGRGHKRLGFAHRTYAEFLAARYLIKRVIKGKQRLSLICHPGDQQQRIVPQLAETAAWLASMDGEAFDAIMRQDPQVLLRSDVTRAEEQDRAAVVASLLEQFEQGLLDDSDWELRWHYRKLRHSNLASQLAPYIRETSRTTLVRRLAIDLAEACQETQLHDLLADLALDQTEEHQIRDQAAHAVAEIGDKTTRLRLRPLAEGKGGQDPDDQLRGAALHALWPECLTTKELFDCIERPKMENFGGAYSSFLFEAVVPKLPIADLPFALEWSSKQGIGPSDIGAIATLVEEIVELAWRNSDSTPTFNALVELTLLRIESDDPLCGARSHPTFDRAARRKMVSALVPKIRDFTEHRTRLFHCSPPSIDTDDLEWLLEQSKSSGADSAPRWAWLAGRAYRWHPTNTQHYSAIVEASATCPVLAAEFSWMLEPVLLDSPKADEARKRYAEELELEKKIAQLPSRPTLTPPPHAQVARLLDACEAGNLDAWWQLNMALQLEPTSTHYQHYFQADLTVLPGWKDASEETRTRILEAAKQYVLKREDQPNEWLGTDDICHPDMAGFRAIVLLHRLSPEFMETLTAGRWANWAPAILGLPCSSGLGDASELQRELAGQAYVHAPDALIAAVLPLLRRDNERFEHLYILYRLDRCWDSRLCNALLQEAKDGALKSSCLGHLLGELMKQGCADSQLYAEGLLVHHSWTDDSKRTRAIAAAVALWCYAPDCGWTALWPVFQEDPDFGKAVLIKVTREGGQAPHGAARLTDEQNAKLYVWLSKSFPSGGAGTGQRMRRDSVADYQRGVLGVLQHRGTRSACLAIESIIREFPDANELAFVLRAARQTVLRETWNPLKATELFELVQRHDSRLIRSSEELQDVILESLNRLQARMHGENPAVRDLWDRQSGGQWRPVDENDLSDYVARHLRQDLKGMPIVALREVEIQRGRGGDSGERTDIHVTGFVDGPAEGSSIQVRVIVETKGCWHAELRQAMKTQLADRYLAHCDCEHGLYLVGWFNSVIWDTTDTRRDKALSLTIEEARDVFDRQARNVSGQLNVRSYVLDCAMR